MAGIIRLVAVGSALATGAAVISLLPSASAAEDKSAEDIIDMCNHSAVINGGCSRRRHRSAPASRPTTVISSRRISRHSTARRKRRRSTSRGAPGVADGKVEFVLDDC
ncbi:hypothetical protein [Streptomyces sp. NPDC091215]|uniref:hypothetical protein n=1 Tax=Streptomyces sp. NPDC091215 TaxID=3155192 RepID=UPI0034219818